MREKLTAPWLDDDHKALLSYVPDDPPQWTRDIAFAAGYRHIVQVCGIRLRRLLKAGLIEKTVDGGPARQSLWRRTTAGRAALQKDKGNG